VQVQVIIHPGAGRYAEIKAEIEALRLHRRLQQPLRVYRQRPKLLHLVFA
jgi:hypothetical protein